jgi:hypothetical protein
MLVGTLNMPECRNWHSYLCLGCHRLALYPGISTALYEYNEYSISMTAIGQVKIPP